MRINARALRFLLLLLLPIGVAVFDLGIVVTVLLVLAWLIAAWLAALATFRPRPGPKLILETIAPSHYAEKVRWVLDRLELEYEERVCAATLGAFFGGRTVPVLHVRTGAVMSRIGNSTEILRFLWGCHGEALGERAAFLRPTEERVALEASLDSYGADLQRWVYDHLLDDRAATLHAWGVDDPRIPLWQRWVLSLSFPLLRTLIRRAFRISPKNVEKGRNRIEALLTELDDRLAAGAGALLGAEPDYTDLTLAALSSIWLQPERFARGQAAAVRLDDDLMPASMREERDRWVATYPALVAHLETLYAER